MQSFRIWKLLLLLWRPYQYNARCEKNTCFIVVFTWFLCFFYQGFLSQTLTIHRTASEGRVPPFIPLYHFHPLTNIKKFIYNIYLHVRWLSRIFNRNACVYQTATRWDLPTYQINIWLTDWWCNVYLFTWWIDSRFLLERFGMRTGGFELASTITLVFQANRLTKCASHTKTLWRNYQFSINIFKGASWYPTSRPLSNPPITYKNNQACVAVQAFTATLLLDPLVGSSYHCEAEFTKC